MRREHPAVVHGVPEPGAEGEDDLEARPGDHPGSVHLGVVEDECRPVQGGGDRLAHVETRPRGDELRDDLGPWTGAGDVVGSRDDYAVPDHARHPHRDAVGGGKVVGQRPDRADEPLGRQGVRSRDADRLGVHGARRIEDGRLDPAAAAVHREGQRSAGHRAQATPR